METKAPVNPEGVKEQPIHIAEPEIVAMGKLSEEPVIVKRVKIKKIEEETIKEIEPEAYIDDIYKEEKHEEKKEAVEEEEKQRIDFEYFKKMPWEQKKRSYTCLHRVH